MADEQKPRAIISRAAMEGAIRDGGSVMLDGRLYTRLDQLPPEDTLALAAADPARQAQAVEVLRADIAAMQQRLAALAPAPAPAEEAKPPADAPVSNLDTPRPAEDPKPAEDAPASNLDTPAPEAQVTTLDSPADPPAGAEAAEEVRRFGRRR